MKVFKAIISTILALIIIPIVMVFIVYLSTTSIASKQGVKDLIKKVSLSSVLVDQDGEYNSLGREIKQELVENGLPEDVIDEFIDSEQISDFFSDYVGDAVGYLLYEDELEKLTAEDISKLINDNVDDIVDELRERKVEGYEELTDERVAEFKAEVNKLSGEIEESIPDLKKSIDDSDAGIAVKIIRLVFSKLVLFIFITIIAILSLLIVLLNLKNYRYGIWLGVIFIIASLPFMLLASSSPFVNINASSKAIEDTIRYLLDKTCLFALIFFGLGIALIIFTIIMRIVSKKRKNRKNNTIAPTVDPVAPTEPIATESVNAVEPVVQVDPEEPTEPVVTKQVEAVEPEPAELTSEPTVTEQSQTDEDNNTSNECFCAECGAKLNDGQKFCYNCGASKK